MARKGIYHKGNTEVECQIIRRGRLNTRIRIGEIESLVPTSAVVQSDDATDRKLNELIIPKTPLESLYRKMRKLTGAKAAQFASIRKLICERHGASDADFLAELFRRSVAHSAFYCNVAENFCPDRDMWEGKNNYAPRLVCLWNEKKSTFIDNDEVSFVDYEIFPFRTTYSCTELGQPGKSTASGGMDLLLALNRDQKTIPVVGEIKANTEQVGPTFALIQALMYASQIATKNQFARLKEWYKPAFGSLDLSPPPSVGIFVIFQPNAAPEDQMSEDLRFALETKRKLLETLKGLKVDSIAFVEFFECDGNELNLRRIELEANQL